MTFTLNDLEDSEVHFRDLLRRLTPEEHYRLNLFLIMLLDYLLEKRGQK